MAPAVAPVVTLAVFLVVLLASVLATVLATVLVKCNIPAKVINPGARHSVFTCRPPVLRPTTHSTSTHPFPRKVLHLVLWVILRDSGPASTSLRLVLPRSTRLFLSTRLVLRVVLRDSGPASTSRRLVLPRSTRLFLRTRLVHSTFFRSVVRALRELGCSAVARVLRLRRRLKIVSRPLQPTQEMCGAERLAELVVERVVERVEGAVEERTSFLPALEIHPPPGRLIGAWSSRVERATGRVIGR